MKLYFYILETPKEGPPVLKIEGCEAEIRNGLVYPAQGKFFHPAVGGFALECHIGVISGKKETPVVILKEPDLKLARQLLAEHARRWTNHYKSMTDLWQSKLIAAEGRKHDIQRVSAFQTH